MGLKKRLETTQDLRWAEITCYRALLLDMLPKPLAVRIIKAAGIKIKPFGNASSPAPYWMTKQGMMDLYNAGRVVLNHYVNEPNNDSIKPLLIVLSEWGRWLGLENRKNAL